MRINTVKKSRKSPGSCCRCGRVIEKGEGYRWVQAYRGAKRCFCNDCELRASDTTSGRLGEVYAAQEGAHDSLAAWDGETVEDLSTLLETLNEELERLRDEYQEAAEAIGEHFEGSDQHSELEEAADGLDGWCSQVDDLISELSEGFDEDEEDEETEDERTARRANWLEEKRDAVENVINDCPL